MNSLVAMVLVLALIALTAAVGLWLKAKQTRVKHVTDDAKSQVAITPQQLASDAVDLPRFGVRATVVQFSSEQCSRCPSTARVLSSEAIQHEGLEYIEIDITRRDELVRDFKLMRTPTVLLLDGEGQVRSRVSGPIGPDQAKELLASL